MGKVNGFKLKVKEWKNNVAKMCFPDFEVFDNYLKECGWEHHLYEVEKALDVWMSELIIEHLDMMQEN